ncbi:hypothetical protein MASR2M66_29610 [Chloroflexota bacterium]
MTRTLLYYPKITFRNPGWIRQAILYWDQIGSIVPREFEKDKIYRGLTEFKILEDQGLYRMFHPDDDVFQAEDFADEFIAFLESKKPRSAPDHMYQYHRFEIYTYKMHPKLVEYLLDPAKSLATPLERYKISLPTVEGLIYMAYLAKYLADQDYRSATTPSTDYRLYRDLVFHPNSQRKSFPSLIFTLQDVLPVPLDDVPIEKILDFKKKRELELLQFREVIDQFEAALKKVQEKGEIQHILQVFSEKIKVNVELLDRLANDERMSTRLGTLENILNIENLETVLNLAEIVTNPISISTARKVVGGALSAGKYMLDKSNQQRANLSRSSYSFLYYAKEEGII